MERKLPLNGLFIATIFFACASVYIIVILQTIYTPNPLTLEKTPKPAFPAATPIYPPLS